MSAYYAITIENLLFASTDEVVGQLAINQSGIQQAQLYAWHEQVLVCFGGRSNIHTLL